MENQPPLDRNSIEGITEADKFFLAYETTRDDTVNEKAKASHEAREVSTTFTVNDPLTLYSLLAETQTEVMQLPVASGI